MKRTLSGTVTYQDLEGGLWLLVGDDGVRYQLAGGDDGLRQDGQHVEVEGDVDRDTMSFGMVGPVLKVRRYRRG